MNILNRGLPLLMTLATLGCAHGGIGSADGWSVVKTKHFSVYTLYPRETQLLMRDLELGYASLGATFFKHVTLPPIDVLALSPETFDEVFGFFRSTITLAQAPGGGAIGRDGLIITKDDKARPFVADALAHLFLHKAAASTPLWFHEGFAGYVRTVQYGQGPAGQLACFGILAREKEPLIPMRTMLGISWDDYDGDQARNWYRYTSRILIDYILHGAAGKNAIRMRPLLDAINQGKPGQESLEAAFPSVALEILDRKLSEHAADVVYQMGSEAPVRGLCPLPAAIAADRSPDESKPTVEAAPAPAVAALFQAVLKLPRRLGYPPWYPPDIIARAR